MINRKNVNLLLLFIIFVIGLALRIHRVGEDSFWYDEVGQVEAALQPHIIDILNAVRIHAGAMPLDYLVTKFMTMFSLREEIIRLPAVLWGTFSIVIYYLLIAQLEIPYREQTALLSAFLIALSPVNIQYSQEARFYASLMFFYGLATFFLVKAVTTHAPKNWLAYLICNIIGIYFHPYLIFTIITGFLLIAHQVFIKKEGQNINGFRENLISYIACCASTIIVFLPGYVFFHAQDAYAYEFGLAPDSVLYGLGLKATVSSEFVPPFGIWHISLFFGLFAGVVFIQKHLVRYASVSPLLTSVIIQIIIIMLLDYWNGYPFIPRQVAHFTPFVYLLFSIGFWEITSHLKNKVYRRIVVSILLAGLILTALPYIELVYDYSKGGTREIAQAIIERHQPGEKVVTIYAQHETVLRFYLSQLVGENDAARITESFEKLEDIKTYIQDNPEVHFVYLPRNTDADVRKEIVDLGFKLLKISEDTDFIFVRK